MNELIPYSKENNPKDKMTTKNIQELKVNIYTNNVHVPFRCHNYKNFMVKHVLL